MAIRIVKSDFGLLENDWRSLEERGYIKWPYLTYDWMYTWWKHYSHRAEELILLAAYDGDELLGLAPLYSQSMYLRGRLRLFRMITPLGSREIDFYDFILRDDPQPILEKIFEFLYNNYPGYVLYLCDLREYSSICQHVVKRIYRYVEIEPGNLYPYVNLPDDYKKYYAELGNRTRKDIRYNSNRLKKLSGFRVGQIGSQFDIDSLYRLHYRRWHMDAHDPKIERMERYERKIIDILKKKDLLRMLSLYVNDACIGVLLSYDYNDVRYYHKIGYDLNYARYSLGKLLINWSIQDAIERGIKTFDMLRGDEEYKRYFTKTAYRCYNLIAGGRALAVRLFRFLKKL